MHFQFYFEKHHIIWTIQDPASVKTDLTSKTDRHFKPLSAKASRLAGLVD
jgi:hypothetical protein